MYDEELDIHADAPMEVSPGDPDYKDLIPFLPPDQIDQAREFAEKAAIQQKDRLLKHS